LEGLPILQDDRLAVIFNNKKDSPGDENTVTDKIPTEKEVTEIVNHHRKNSLNEEK
jgi:hypothetical protein